LGVRLQSVLFPGPAGELEGLWKEAAGPRRGAAVFAHPHPLHGGTMHNKVVYRAVQALTQSGFATLRFQFRGVGLSKGRYDAGRGEVEDVRSAIDEAQARGGLPLVAGGFSFGAAMALKASDGDPRVSAFIGLGLPVATESGRMLPRPPAGRPALFVVGERDAYGPPDDLERFLQTAPWVRRVVIPGADHFFEGQLEEVGAAIRAFLETLPLPGVEDKAS
jgi:uncharacterized protein